VRSGGREELDGDMRIAIEESGNFGFPDDGRSELYLLIALIAPESAMPSIDKVADAIRQRTGHGELKANKLGSKRLALAADPISRRPLTAVVYALDSEMMDRRFIAEFRLKQAIRIAHVRDDLLSRGHATRHSKSRVNSEP
jgi:hypothetical protein